MKLRPNESLPNDVNALKQLVLSQQGTLLKHQEDLVQKSARIQFLEEQIILFRHRQFGQSSEKNTQQVELFDESEVEACPTAPEVAEAVESGQAPVAKKSRSGRKPLPQNLPRVRVEHDVVDSDKVCACGCQKSCIGEETSEQLDIIPAVIQVLVHARMKYACKDCESGVTIAALPPQPIPKSNASAGLLAHIATAKYQDGLPLYRMEAIFKRLSIHLPRNTQANWMIKGAQLLQPLYNLLNDHLLDSGYVHMDETRVQVLKELDKLAQSLSYMWVRRTGDPNLGDPNQTVVLFDYHSSRSAGVVDELLGGYQGYLQTDDYVGYHKMGLREGITHLGCMAHARRKFIEAQKVAPSAKGKVSKADMAVSLIKELYQIESGIKGQSPEQRMRVRQEQSVPQLAKLRKWLDKSLIHTPPKSKTGVALGYLHKNWSKLTAYTQDGRLNIDNNPVENAIRPFAIGRKNWMFSNSQAGAKASAMLYSIIETAKANGLEPYAYLKLLFTKLPSCETVEDVEKLLPWNPLELSAQ
jgi:transposase